MENDGSFYFQPFCDSRTFLIGRFSRIICVSGLFRLHTAASDAARSRMGLRLHSGSLLSFLRELLRRSFILLAFAHLRLLGFALSPPFFSLFLFRFSVFLLLRPR